MKWVLRLAVVLAAVLASRAVPADAQQVFESAGERALGMAGAFVAVADDSTAVYWNPAGLSAGPPAGGTLGWYQFESGNQKSAPAPGPLRQTSTFTSFGTLPVGLSYGKFESSQLGMDETGALGIDVLRTQQYGATFLQSVSAGLVVGTTLKFIHGSAFRTGVVGETAEDALKQATSLDASTHNTMDLDVAALYNMQALRVAVVTKNLRSPSFGDVRSSATTLPRQSRIGLAFLPTRGLTLALDWDLNAVDVTGALRRMMAAGGELKLGTRASLRSGVRWSLEGAKQPVAAVGMSIAVRTGLWIDGHYARGNAEVSREFGIALRAGL